jgi:hypothetical protein
MLQLLILCVDSLSLVIGSARKLVLDPYRWDRVIHKGPMLVSIEDENELYQSTDDDKTPAGTTSAAAVAARTNAAAAATPSAHKTGASTPTSSGSKRGRDDTGIDSAHGTMSVSKRARVVGFFSSAVKAVGSSAMKAGRRVLFGDPSTSNVPGTCFSRCIPVFHN